MQRPASERTTLRHRGGEEEECIFIQQYTQFLDALLSSTSLGLETSLGLVVEEVLFKEKTVNEVDAERDRATPAWETRYADKQWSAVLRPDEIRFI